MKDDYFTSVIHVRLKGLETMLSFETRLREISTNCEYGDLREGIIASHAADTCLNRRLKLRTSISGIEESWNLRINIPHLKVLAMAIELIVTIMNRVLILCHIIMTEEAGDMTSLRYDFLDDRRRITSPSHSYLAPHRGRARYCNGHVCLFVCLCVCLSVFVRVFAKFQSVISQSFLNRSS